MHRILTLLLICSIISTPLSPLETTDLSFDGASAYNFLEDQCDFGTRPPGSENLSQCRTYIAETLQSFGWDVSLQNFTYHDVDCANIIARDSDYPNASIILGAHYDTRPLADRDPNPENRDKPVMGANDGASGTAVLMELARILPEDIRNRIEIVLFDAEDSGDINGWGWIVGSTYYVNQLSPEKIANISAMILLDMVGGLHLRLPREYFSRGNLQDTIWSIAEQLGYSDTFLDSGGSAIYDDHIPFINAGIPSLDIIHHDPFPATWHTVNDIPDNCSPDSLEKVGRVMEYFILNQTGWTGGFEQSSSFPMEFVFIGVIGGLALITLVIYLKRK